MKRIGLYSIVLIMLVQVLPAQLGAGYMGKRCVVGYGVNFSPAVFGPNAQESSLLQIGNSTGGEIAFNSMHEGFLEFAFKSRTCVGFSAKYYKTSYANQEPLDMQVFGSFYGNYINESPPGMYSIKGLDYSLYFKFYPRRYVAPWGRYIIAGAVFNKYVCTYDPSRMNIKYNDANTNQVVTLNFGPTEQDYFRGDLRFGWGRSRILFNRVTLDYGVNLEVLALLANVFTKVDDFFYKPFTNMDYIERTSKRRVREVSGINVFVKLGVLVF
jgi:hypothetical protein